MNNLKITTPNTDQKVSIRLFEDSHCFYNKQDVLPYHLALNCIEHTLIDLKNYRPNCGTLWAAMETETEEIRFRLNKLEGFDSFILEETKRFYK